MQPNEFRHNVVYAPISTLSVNEIKPITALDKLIVRR